MMAWRFEDVAVEGLSDQDLIERCQKAGRRYDQAFEALYRRHAARVFGFLVRMTGDRAAAEDALQETFLRVHKSLERFDTSRDLSAWLLQIARYVAIDAHRVESKVKRLEERRAQERAEADRHAPPPAGGAEAGERARVVDAALAELSPEDRSLLLLRHDVGLTFRAIGEAADCSARTAQNRVEAAARRLQQALARRRVRRGDEL